MEKIKVFVIDGSIVIRRRLSEIINSSQFLEIVGTSASLYEAKEKIEKLNPDVVTLDIEVSHIDDIVFLKDLMHLRPIPVVMISAMTEKGSRLIVKALELGVVDYIKKPTVSVSEGLLTLAGTIVTKIRMAAKVNVTALHGNKGGNKGSNKVVKYSSTLSSNGNKKLLKNEIGLIAIGASTGGVEATKRLLSDLPREMPPIAIVQHMPSGFTHSYAARLNSILDADVYEFSGKEKPLLPSHIYIANGNQHFSIRATSGRYLGYCTDDAPVNQHRPAVDVLFNSVAACASGRSIAILLTGMGVDGAAGMENIKQTGAVTIAQDEQSSVVWGMPKVAIEKGSANYILPLDKIGPFIVDLCYG